MVGAHPLPDVRGADKYGRGTVVVVGGSPSTPGAVLLAGTVALRMGAGRLRIATSAGTATAVAVALPEAKVVALPTRSDGSLGVPDQHTLADALDQADVVLIGPGAEPAGTEDLLRAMLEVAGERTVFVLDAAAVGATRRLSTAELLAASGRLVMTPNRSEALEVLDRDDDDDLADVLTEVAGATGAVVTSFGQVACPDGRTFVVPTPPAGLGTSGSGDVLAGLVAGAAAHCDDLALAACWATHAHVDAGQRLVGRRAFGGYLASELLAAVGAAGASGSGDAATHRFRCLSCAIDLTYDDRS